MGVYGAIDLHSKRSFVVLCDEEGVVVLERRVRNDLGLILGMVEPFRNDVVGLAVESTYNWYWLVDGLMEDNYKVHLVNTGAVKQYEGLKHGDDRSDARWLAELLRLGILPEGYIYPREQRPVRDLLRKRAQLVEQQTSNVLSIGNQMARSLGLSVRSNEIRRLSDADVDGLLGERDLALAVKANLSVMRCLQEQISGIERVVKERVKLRPEFKQLLTVPGIGDVLGLTIALETGDIRRFPHGGNFASYCRCVESRRLTDGKKKGKGNRKNGNKYLAWAFSEAATFARRYSPAVRRFYQRKVAKRNEAVAHNAVAHKLARASYYIMRDGVPFDDGKAFGTRT
jgi:transposase